METKQITSEMKAMLDKPLPPEAIKQHPTKKFLSTINAIFVTERLNETFGVGAWQTKTEAVTTAPTKNGTTMVVTKTIFTVPAYGIYYECYGGNDNADLGDAYKGSMTDALTKIGSYLGIGAHVWKNNPTPAEQPASQPKPQTDTKRKDVTDFLNNLPDDKCQQWINYFHIDDIDKMPDAKVVEVWNYMHSQKK